MEWIEISVRTLQEFEDEISGIFYSLGANGLEICDPRDIEFIKNDPESWSVFEEKDFENDGHMVIKAYFEHDEGEKFLINLRDKLKEYKETEISTNIVRDEDWAENWKKYYYSIRIGEKLFISPKWEDVEVPKDRVLLKIDPGMAFGTGTHETTKLCLEAMERYVKPGMKVLDVGTGSGILAIGSVLLGAESAVGVDIDPVAVKMARENVELNNLGGMIDIVCGDLLENINGPFDLLVSNIVAEILIKMMEDIKKVLNPGAIFISSGIIYSKEEDMKNALKDYGFKIIERNEEKGWVEICAREE